MDEGYVAYISSDEELSLLLESSYDSDKVNFFSVYDDIIDLLGRGVSKTLNDLKDLQEYNAGILEKIRVLNLQKSTERNRVLSNTLYITDPYANPSFFHSAPYDFGINCNFNWGNSFPSGISAAHHRIIDLKRCPGSGGKDWQAEVDLKYITAGVYFELRSELNYSSNPVMSSNKTSVNNNYLVLSNYYHYERRRRFQSNLIVEDTRTVSVNNASYLRNIVYSGSRSLVWFVLKPTFSYDDMSNNDPTCSSCTPFDRRTVSVL